MKLAPIALFVYNRLSHTRRTVEALQKNILASDSDLIIFSDGPRNEVDVVKVIELRKYLKTINVFKSVKIIYRDKNYGLAKSIISGVTEVVNEYGKIIVLEDDMVSSNYFLEYMNKSLNMYELEDKVISIHAYVYPINNFLDETFFLRGADCWGWATWKRGWDLFEADGQKLFNELKNKKLIKKFNFSNSYPYSKMLKDQIVGKNNSWAIRWHASAFLKDKLTLYPNKSLIVNIGFDGSGVHCGDKDIFNQNINIENIKINVEKIEIKENDKSRALFVKFFRSQNNLYDKAILFLKRIFKYVIKN